jgi:hypothetical protein
MTFSIRAVLVSVAAAALVMGLAVACGARGPLDTVVIEKVYVEASVDSSVADVTNDTAADAPADVPSEAPAEAEVDAGFDAGGPINCVTCLTDNCGTTLVTCVTDPGCLMALQCTAQMCLTGGTPNLQCLGNCTGGDAAIQQDLLSTIGCVIGNCPACTSLLGGLGGMGAMGLTSRDSGGVGGDSGH